MIVIVTVDDRNGLMFNQRRLSQDRVLRQHILALSAQSVLWMNAYTEKQFLQDGPITGQIHVDDAFMEKAAAGEYCFVENRAIASYEKEIEQIVLFKWNRKYPADVFLDIDIAKKPWKRISTEDFPGSSHEKITQEVYGR